MNEMQVFNSAEFGEIRCVEINGEPWMVARDVAKALGYAKPENAIATHVDSEDKTSTLIQGSGSNYKSQAVVINESGLYSLVLSSNLPDAKKFRRWITSEVLPSLRKNGGYLVGQEEMPPEELLSRALIYANKTIEDQKAEINDLRGKAQLNQPKVLFADAVSTARNTITIGDLAKILNQNGVDTGRTRLFKWMRENGYLVKTRGLEWNMPTQRAMNAGLMEIKESVTTYPDHTDVHKTPKVTGKGQVYFINLFLNKEGQDGKLRRVSEISNGQTQ